MTAAAAHTGDPVTVLFDALCAERRPLSITERAVARQLARALADDYSDPRAVAALASMLPPVSSLERPALDMTRLSLTQLETVERLLSIAAGETPSRPRVREQRQPSHRQLTARRLASILDSLRGRSAREEERREVEALLRELCDGVILQPERFLPKPTPPEELPEGVARIHVASSTFSGHEYLRGRKR
jgi:hypothetical protein